MIRSDDRWWKTGMDEAVKKYGKIIVASVSPCCRSDMNFGGNLVTPKGERVGYYECIRCRKPYLWGPRT